MAQQPKKVMEAAGARRSTGLNGPAGVAAPSVLPLFRFRLRHLFWFVAAVSILLASLVSSQGVAALAVLLGALVVAFHLFSTALGSQLRLHADHRQACDVALLDSTGSNARTTKSGPPRPDVNRLCSPWYGRSGASLPWLGRLVASAVLGGGCLGGLLLAATMGQRASPAGLIVGALSLAVLSGWFAFLGGSFIGIVRGGLSDAAAEQDPDNGRQTVRK